jgi:hypothetical protein
MRKSACLACDVRGYLQADPKLLKTSMTVVVISELEYSAASKDSSIRVSLIVARSSTYLGGKQEHRTDYSRLGLELCILE